MNPAYRRLKSKNGETLVETLAATLLVSLAMIAFSVMLSTTANIITTSRDTINNYIKSENKYIDSDPDSDSNDNFVEVKRVNSVNSNLSEDNIKFTDSSGDKIKITPNVFKRGNNIKIVSYKKTIAD